MNINERSLVLVRYKDVTCEEILGRITSIDVVLVRAVVAVIGSRRCSQWLTALYTN